MFTTKLSLILTRVNGHPVLFWEAKREICLISLNIKYGSSKINRGLYFFFLRGKKKCQCNRIQTEQCLIIFTAFIGLEISKEIWGNLKAACVHWVKFFLVMNKYSTGLYKNTFLTTCKYSTIFQKISHLKVILKTGSFFFNSDFFKCHLQIL